ncbi:ABC transporter permease subunit [Paenibacillus sp. CGMCC 1.16610]|uniref:ABC transporter permease subunit n=1 Tax=Paenibacillus anseongense TaxID=2682845 RepID=A0ABW9UGK6_9BACL|nr:MULTISPECIES: ABC transporter permease subunit [Paenibacillus]MBA2940688.1 ABC transporter permease subunit [Paenibacillus sp. CGMCC 1.16610]MVQ37540.1 ABC transporter permease subunit [Paenibacillus anseongense]
MDLQESLKAVSNKDTSWTGIKSVSPKKPFNKQSFVIRLTLIALALLTVFAFVTFDYKDINLVEAASLTAQTVKTMFFQPLFQHITFFEAIKQLTITLGLAFLTTLFGSIIALFLGLLAARNLSNPRLSIVIKAGVAFIRAVPTVLWVLIFAVAAGLGSVAAVIGMTFHSISYLVKAYSESFEELDKGVIEALKASGANWWQIVFQAVLPSSVSYLISWTFMRFEINFAVALAMGAAAGAGGIGFDMFMASSFYYDVREIGAITYLILAFAILLELLAAKIKKKLRVHG